MITVIERQRSRPKDLTDINRIFYPKYTFFSSSDGSFSMIDYMLDHKTSLSKYKKIEIIPILSSDHNCMKLEINNTKCKTGKFTNTWKLTLI